METADHEQPATAAGAVPVRLVYVGILITCIWLAATLLEPVRTRYFSSGQICFVPPTETPDDRVLCVTGEDRAPELGTVRVVLSRGHLTQFVALLVQQKTSEADEGAAYIVKNMIQGDGTSTRISATQMRAIAYRLLELLDSEYHASERAAVNRFVLRVDERLELIARRHHARVLPSQSSE